jgi:hypothetical protein
VQEQVKRPFKDVKSHTVGHASAFCKVTEQ